jgi:hypothetical protein
MEAITNNESLPFISGDTFVDITHKAQNPLDLCDYT